MGRPTSLEGELLELSYYAPNGEVYDLRSEFYHIKFTESIFSNFIKGSISFQDMNGITEFNQGYSGGYIKLSLRTNEAFDTINKFFWIYKTGRDEALEKTYQFNRRIYNFSFATAPFRNELYERYSRYYENLYPHEIVQLICKDMLNINEFQKIDKTKDKISFASNFSLSPLDTIDHCIKKSYSVSNQDVGYVFFESSKGFYFVSLFELLKQKHKYELSMNPPDKNNLREDQYQYFNKIIDYRTQANTSYIKSYMNHRFGATMHHLDMKDKRFKKIEHDYPTYLKETMNLGTKSVSTPEHQNTKAFTFPYFSEGVNRDYLMANCSRMDLMNDNVLSIDLPGDSRKQCGEIVKIDYLSKSQNDLLNRELRGNYIIQEIEHYMGLNKKYMQKITVSKDGLNKGVNALDTGKNNPGQ